MDNFREWLMQKEIWCRISETTHLEVKWLLQDLKNKAVGLGVSGLYKFTYGFTAQVSMLIVFIRVCLEFLACFKFCFADSFPSCEQPSWSSG